MRLSREGKEALALLFLSLLALGLFLGSRGLNEPDEGRYAELGREMAMPGGDWLVPHLNGFEHFQKPPLLYWLTAASLRLFGINEWAARLPSALAALGTVALTCWLGGMLWHRRAGLFAGMVLLSMAEFFALARLLTPDMLLTFWVVGAIAAFVRYQRGGSPWWRWMYFIAMGLGFLTKGPLALVIPLSAALCWTCVPAGEGSAPRPLPWVRGLFLSLALGLSWFVVLSCSQQRLFDYFWRYELVERFASRAHGRAKPFWFFVPVLLAGTLPWSTFGPALVRSAWARIRARSATRSEHLLLGWCVIPFLILSLSGSKLPTYVLPLFSALAIALGGWLSHRSNWLRLAWPLTGTALVLWLTGAALLPRYNDLLRQQASVGPLARMAAGRPDAAQARFFACEVRAQGFPFVLQRLVSASEAQSDIVLPLSDEQRGRVLHSPEHCEQEVGHTAQPGYGLIRADRFARSFTPADWEVLGKAGDFLLITDTPWRHAHGFR